MGRPDRMKGEEPYDQRDLDATKALERFIPKSSARARLRRERFKRMCKTAGMTLQQGFQYHVGRYMRLYKPSTADNYANDIWHLIKKNPTPRNWWIKKALSAWATAMREEIVRKQPCSIQKMIRVMMALKPHYRLVCFFGLVIGLRPEDTRWLRRDCFTWVYFEDPETTEHPLGYYQYHLLFSKNRRSLSDRATSPEIPFEWSMDPRPLMKELTRLDEDSKEFMVTNYSYQGLYNALRRAQAKIGMEEGEDFILPMDYRRYYINQVCQNAACRLWTEFTMHKNPKMIRAHYMWIRNLHNSSPAFRAKIERIRLEDQEEDEMPVTRQKRRRN